MTPAPQNETVFFKVKGDERQWINCLLNDLRGWHIGWHSGTRWHSYLAGTISPESEIEEWRPLGIGEKREAT